MIYNKTQCDRGRLGFRKYRQYFGRVFLGVEYWVVLGPYPQVLPPPSEGERGAKRSPSRPGCSCLCKVNAERPRPYRVETE